MKTIIINNFIYQKQLKITIMSKEEVLPVEGLEEGVVTATDVTTEEVKKEKKVQTPEEEAILVAGVAKLREIGIDEKLSVVLDLVSGWNGDKTELTAKKDAVIKAFEGSDNLKNYIDGDFQTAMVPFQGISKVMPVLNNIKSFYARRENAVSTKKAKLVQISISGVIYNVDPIYMDSVAAEPKDVRKALILAHASTVKVEVAELF